MRLALVALVLLLATGVAANPDDDASAPGQPAAVTAESYFNQGQALARQSDWAGAEQAYREATRVRPAFPEAWNGLGHALRKRGKFEESVKAYQEALRLRPQYPQAESDRKSTRLNSSHGSISYAVFCLKKKENLSHKHGHSDQV